MTERIECSMHLCSITGKFDGSYAANVYVQDDGVGRHVVVHLYRNTYDGKILDCESLPREVAEKVMSVFVKRILKKFSQQEIADLFLNADAEVMRRVSKSQRLEVSTVSQPQTVKQSRSRLSHEQIETVRQMRDAGGYSPEFICKKVGISRATLYRILKTLDKPNPTNTPADAPAVDLNESTGQFE